MQKEEHNKSKGKQKESARVRRKKMAKKGGTEYMQE